MQRHTKVCKTKKKVYFLKTSPLKNSSLPTEINWDPVGHSQLLLIDKKKYKWSVMKHQEILHSSSGNCLVRV